MNLDEIYRYLELSSTKSVCIDRSLVSSYPGFVREITIEKDNIAKIEFNIFDYDEGGFTVKVVYENFELLVASIEQYISKKISEWENCSKTGWYPEIEEKVNYEASGNKLKDDLIHKKIKLPLNGKEYKIPPGYWKDLAEGKIKEVP